MDTFFVTCIIIICCTNLSEYLLLAVCLQTCCSEYSRLTGCKTSSICLSVWCKMCSCSLQLFFVKLRLNLSGCRKMSVFILDVSRDVSVYSRCESRCQCLFSMWVEMSVCILDASRDVRVFSRCESHTCSSDRGYQRPVAWWWWLLWVWRWMSGETNSTISHSNWKSLWEL